MLPSPVRSLRTMVVGALKSISPVSPPGGGLVGIGPWTATRYSAGVVVFAPLSGMTRM